MKSVLTYSKYRFPNSRHPITQDKVFLELQHIVQVTSSPASISQNDCNHPVSSTSKLPFSVPSTCPFPWSLHLCAYQPPLLRSINSSPLEHLSSSLISNLSPDTSITSTILLHTSDMCLGKPSKDQWQRLTLSD